MAAKGRRSFFLVLAVLLACGVLGAVFGQAPGQNPQGDSQISNSLRSFTDAYNIVEQNYAEPVNPDKAIYDGAIPGMLRVLDPHSTFFDPKAYAMLKESQSGKYYGIGMTIGPRNNHIVVIAPFAGTPAYKAGIRPGDVIVAVNGKPTDNMSTEEVAELVRGPKGTSVTLTILREGEPKPLQFAVERAEIPHYSVDLHFLLRPGIGYLHVASFDETTVDEVQNALGQFGSLQGLVLDLRQDPGGLLNSAVGVADKFLPKGAVVVSQAGRASPEKVYHATRGEDGKPYPIVVLVDRGTASGAEIVAGAIQDHDRGLIAGENTFGKGLVQTVFPLSEDTGLALTTAKYYTPSGRLIQRNYNGVSLYDYYFERNSGNNNSGRETKYTDSGRTVYGGDGISPDVKIPPPKNNSFQDTILVHYVFFNFAQDYLQHHHLTKAFQVTDQVLQDFRNFLSRQNVPYSEADMAQNLDWVKWNLRSEMFTDAFGMEAGLQVHAEADPEVVQALQLLPQARQLAQNARRIIAERKTAASLQSAHSSAVHRQ
ncbi:MAG TPA: S41 family peptidase [Terriglobales bacterium]|nr:S41 family peptidase [Terriglobales bacterium]